MKTEFGLILSKWRSMRRVSQLNLAELTGVSQRHISFVESGRAQPSCDVIMRLADGLGLPLRVRNELLLAAGYAPRYRERRLDLAEMKHVSEALHRILDHHEPYPAIVTNAEWNIVMHNETAGRIIALCAGQEGMSRLAQRGSINFMRLMFSDFGLRPYILNWVEIKAMLLERLRREAIANPVSPSATLWRDFSQEPPAAGSSAPSLDEPQLDPVLALELMVDGTKLRFFNTLTTFGTSQDVALQELRIDMSFPADQATCRYLETNIDKVLQSA
jgi:transcriptional regulator with XRE-family HTH domain